MSKFLVISQIWSVDNLDLTNYFKNHFILARVRYSYTMLIIEDEYQDRLQQYFDLKAELTPNHFEPFFTPFADLITG